MDVLEHVRYADAGTEPRQDQASTEALGDIPEKAVALVDAFFEYFVDTLWLQAFLLETDVRAFAKRLGVCAMALAVGLAGFTFLSVGAANWVNEFMGSRIVGYLLVGSVHIVVSLIIVGFATRQRSLR